MRIRKRVGEETDEYMVRVARRSRELREEGGVKDWDVRLVEKAVGWAGHLRRTEGYDAKRLAPLVLRYKDREYLDACKGFYKSQCHGRRLHVWRWESELFNFFSNEGYLDWESRATDKLEWRDHFDRWLTWRKLPFGSRGLR